MYEVIGIILMFLGIFMIGICCLLVGLWASKSRSIDALMRAGVSEEEAKIIVREYYRANGL